MKKTVFLHVVSLLIFSPLYAEIITDGSLGTQINLAGPNFQIEAGLGQQRGGNLFHSFQEFNLENHESATFSGANTIQNVISRVTGGHASQIDGLLRSTIPNADIYFLNPYGLIFGPNARLDISGSFHASTADYLRLGKGIFNARQPNDSVLTVAPVEAFGFLTNSPSAIQLQNSQLFVSLSKTLSLIGGDLLLQGTVPSADNKDTFHPDYTLKIFADFGRINLVSLASPGTVMLTPSEIVVETENMGNIRFENAWAGVSGEGAGDIFVHGRDFILYQSELEGDSRNDDSGIINIQVENLVLEGAEIATDTHGAGQGGKIAIKVADTLILSASEQDFPSFIFSGTEGHMNDAGHSGQIEITARQIILKEGAEISSFSQGPGEGGAILITTDILKIIGVAKDDIHDNDTADLFGNTDGLFGDTKQSEPQEGIVGTSGLLTNSTSTASNAGNAGSISIRATKLSLTNEGIITASAVNASGGGITITIPDLLYLKNSRITTSVSAGSGNGGNITLSNPEFVILDESQIKAQAHKGKGGNIRIIANQFIKSPESIVSASSELGIDGNVEVHAPDETVSNSLVAISGDRIDASGMLKKPCSARVAEKERSHFYVHKINGVQPAPYDRQGSDVLPAPPTTSLPVTSTTTMSFSTLPTTTLCQKPTIESTQDVFIPLF